MSGKNDCQNRREAIAAFVLGELGAEAADDLQKHIDGCQGCRSFYQALAEEEEVIESAFKAISDKSESIQDSLVERFEKHPATLQEQMRPRRSSAAILSAIMRSKVTRFAAAAAIIIGVFIAIHQTDRPIRVTSGVFADMIEAMKQKPWMHIVMESGSGGQEQQFEVWVSFESQINASKRSSGEATYLDGQRQVSHRYNPGKQAITVSYVDASEITKGATSVSNFWETWLRQMTEAGMSITEETGQFEGSRAKIYKIKGSLGEKGSVNDKMIKSFRGEIVSDVEQKLPVLAHERLFDSKGNLLKDKKLYFDYPESGPKDIYALGVPADAKVVVEGMEPDVQLAGEPKRTETMFAGGTGVGYLRAIELLEKLSAEWSGDAQDNPYAAAIQKIKERLEQDTTTQTSVKDTEDLTGANSVTSTVAAVGITGSGSVYDHFLFTRRNGPEREGETWTLALAKVTAAGFELRDIDTRPRYGRPRYAWQRPLCVADGTVYCANNDRLEWISLVTGETGRLENLPSLSDDSSWWGACYDDGRLYAQAGERNRMLQVLDFRKRAYRDITALEHELERTPIAVSPDHKRIAFFADDPNRRSSRVLLRIVDVESGEISYPIEPIEHKQSELWVRDSTLSPPLPVIWLDGQRVLFVQAASSELPARLVCVNVTTGDMNDVTPLPGRSSPSEVPLIQDNMGAGPLIYKEDDDEDRYRVDVAAGKLVEDDCIGGDYYLCDGHLFDDLKELAAVKREDVKVSPDGKRVIWISDGKLFYHDSAGEAPAAVLEQGTATGGYSLLWLKSEDLKAPTVTAGMPAGWTAFKDRPSEPRDEGSPGSPRPTRENINDHLTFTVETDKDTYLLHEPVELTLTVTSISDSNIEIVAPVVYDPVSGSIVRLILHYPKGSSLIDCGAQPYAPESKNIALRPGEFVTVTDMLEVPRVGQYRLVCEYRGFKGDWQGEPGDSAAFEVKPIDSAEQERVLLEAKFNRLMEKFRYQRSIAPDWDGYQPTVADDIVGIRGMGPKVGPYLIEAVKDENDTEARQVFYRTLTEVAGPERLPYFRDRLMHGTKYEYRLACDWLYNLYHKAGEGSGEALEMLLSAMNHNDADVRDEAADVLSNIYDPNVEACFERALEDEDKGVRTKAARYLAAAEWLGLDEWLDVAAKMPTKARYLAARSITKQIEEHWNITKGELPSVSWEEASKDAEKLEQYRKVVEAWQKWASEYVRYSSGFFDRDREHWVKEPPPTNE